MVLHADIDAFFASVEQLLHPRLAGRPVVVGAGVVASCSYEARRRGLHAGMPIREARELCPGAVVLAGDRHVYASFAAKVFSALESFAPGLETHLDEAYFSLDGLGIPQGGLEAFGRSVRAEVARRSGLSVTVGIGPGKMAAKIAGKTVKPGGVRAVDRDGLFEMMTAMPVEVIPGVGRVTRRILADFNVRTVGALRAIGRDSLRAVFGARGPRLFDLCRGLDEAACESGGIPACISRETSFHVPASDPAEIEGMLFYLCERAAAEARRLSLSASVVSVKIRYSDLRGDEKRAALRGPTQRDDVVFETALSLLHALHRRRAGLRLVGAALSGLAGDRGTDQLDFFSGGTASRRDSLYRALDEIRGRHGHKAVVAGRSLALLGILEQDGHGFVLRTPCLTK